ncbi:AsmA family protein [Rhodobacteraceae bacterium 63075]|nr:AsmA family protein [Rhodobacteraceae bacterium 63075]
MRIMRGALFAVFLFVAFAAVAVLMLPKERIARVASTELSEVLGRDVEITGEIGLSFWPVLGVRTGPVTVAGPDWTEGQPLLKAEAMSIGVGAMAALRREIDIRQVELTRPQINLIRAADGRVSWAFGEGGGESGAAESGGIRPFALARAEIRDGELLYEDRASGTRERLTSLDAQLELPDMAGPANLVASGVRGTGTLTVNLRADNAGDFITGRLTPVRLDLSTGGGSAVFTGAMTRGLDMDGSLSVEAGNTARFLAALGLGDTAPPEGLGQSIDLTSKLIFAGGEVINLRGMELALDQNSLAGDADIRLTGARPKVTARLEAGALDLTSLSSEGGSGEAESGWSTTPIDAGGLGAVDANVRLAVESLDAGMVKLGPSVIAATLDNARAVFKLTEAAGYEGQIVGEFVINNRSGLSVGGNLSMLQGQVQPLLTDLMDVDRLSGTADAYVKFLGVGQSLDAIMRSLSGEGGIAMGRGEISGFDLNALLGNAGGGDGTTVFDKMSASFDIADGVMTNDNLAMSLPNFTASGEGEVNLGAQTVDYLFTPVALKANKGKDLAFPVRIRGPWADPRISVDLQAAIDLNLADKKEEVKAKVEDKIADELGVEREEGESLEDAVKKKAEDKLQEELLKLFD